MVCDVTDFSQVEALADHTLKTYGRLDVWVNNAGWSAPYGPTVHMSPERFLQVTRTNIQGAYHGSLIAMRHFLTHRRGKLINVLGRGERGPVPMQNAYSASKAWLKSFTLALAAEYKDSGVGVFALSPGMMDTDMLLDVEVIQGYEERLRIFNGVVETLSQLPEIPAEKAVWLASSATDGKTGLLVRELTLGNLILLALRQPLNRLLRRPGRRVDVHIRSVPAAFPVVKEQ
jgi:NAD(P)-dependent dehydrogenase (short-subunit alcohol dehydrogenase family)